MFNLPSLTPALTMPQPSGSRPSWVPADAIIGIDAKNNNFWQPFTISSPISNLIGREDTSNAYFQELDDDWILFGSTVIRRTDRGLLSEPSRQNMLLYNRDLTQSEWVKINCTAAKDANGVLFDTENTASTLTATDNDATCLQSITLTERRIISSAYVRRVTGSGTIEMTQDGGLTWNTIAVSGSWQRFNLTSVDLADPEFGFRISISGDEIEVDLAAVEVNGGGNAYPTTPIVTNDSVVTRNQEQLYFKDQSFMPDTGSLLVKLKQPNGVVRYGQQTSRNSRIIEFHDSVSGTRFSVNIVASGIVVEQDNGGGNFTVSEPGDFSQLWVSLAWEDGGNIRASINGSTTQSVSGYTAYPYDTIALGSSYQLSGNNDLWGIYEEIFIFDDAPSDATLETRSTVV